MSVSQGYSRYLSAKRSVDDRALNAHVLERLRLELAEHRDRTIRIVEIGAGIGTMVARMLELHRVAKAEYLLLDVDAQLLSDARAWLTAWSESHGLIARDEGELLRLRGGAGIDVAVSFAPVELGKFLASSSAAVPADLLVAHAFLDLVDVPAMLPRLFDLLVSEGLFYFTLNFDGETIFQPEHSDDAQLLRVYHRSMDERVRYGSRAGDSHCGRHLFGHLRAAGATILAAGASDWTVYPQGSHYPGDEAHFLGAILDTIGAELRQHPELPPDRLDAWLALRRRQLARGELVFLAHQLDFVGRRPGKASL